MKFVRENMSEQRNYKELFVLFHGQRQFEFVHAATFIHHHEIQFKGVVA